MIFLFYLFAAIALAGAIGVVAFKNPVSSAFSLVISFLGLAALFIQLDAYLIGILQILVYAGAIMVLFLFIIMLLDLPAEEKRHFRGATVICSLAFVAGFVALLVTVLKRSGVGERMIPEIATSGGSDSSDIHRIGELLFSQYWFPIEMVGILLLVATVGVVVLSRKELK